MFNTVLQPADIILIDNPNGQGDQSSFINRAIKKVSTEPYGKPAEFGHVGIAESYDHKFAYARVWEMTWDKLRIVSLHEYYAGAKIAVYRHKYLTKYQQEAIVKYFADNVGKPYGIRKILAHCLDYPFVVMLSKLFKKPVRFRLFSSILASESSVCSGMVARAFSKAGSTTFDMDPKTVQPDDIHQFCENNPEVFERIY